MQAIEIVTQLFSPDYNFSLGLQLQCKFQQLHYIKQQQKSKRRKETSFRHEWSDPKLEQARTRFGGGALGAHVGGYHLREFRINHERDRLKRNSGMLNKATEPMLLWVVCFGS